jgi:uncharacterized membrane protein
VKVLVYENRKQPALIWDASTSEKEAAAFLTLFAMLAHEWVVYDDLTDSSRLTPSEQAQRVLFDRALTGDANAAKQLLRLRKDYEYEGWSFGEVLDPEKS